MHVDYAQFCVPAMLADGGRNPCARVDAATAAAAAALLLPVGVRHVCGVPYLVLEDLTGQYSQPCILDVKVRALLLRLTWCVIAMLILQAHLGGYCLL
jgi:hypothetical protein